MLIMTLCGSLPSTSSNHAALAVVERELTKQGTETRRIAGLDTLPPFRSDVALPIEVSNWAAALGEADGLVIASPEYAAGPPGVLKNALDWLVGEATLYRKPVAVICAGSTGGPFTIEALVRTLSYQGAFTVATLGIAGVQPKRGPNGDLVDPQTLHDLAAVVATLRSAIGATEPALLGLITPVLARHGVDASRFGLAAE